MEQFYLKYCDNEACDIMFEYLWALKRPVKEAPQDYADCCGTDYC